MGGRMQNGLRSWSRRAVRVDPTSNVGCPRGTSGFSVSMFPHSNELVGGIRATPTHLAVASTLRPYLATDPQPCLSFRPSVLSQWVPVVVSSVVVKKRVHVFVDFGVLFELCRQALRSEPAAAGGPRFPGLSVPPTSYVWLATEQAIRLVGG
ncbi:hypothetical protein THAOC_21313, partial [Thalassiosira oceanica]